MWQSSKFVLAWYCFQTALMLSIGIVVHYFYPFFFCHFLEFWFAVLEHSSFIADHPRFLLISWLSAVDFTVVLLVLQSFWIFYVSCILKFVNAKTFYDTLWICVYRYSCVQVAWSPFLELFKHSTDVYCLDGILNKMKCLPSFTPMIKDSAISNNGDVCTSNQIWKGV